MICRSCHGNKLKLILNLGSHIPSNFYLSKKKNNVPKKIPLETYVCQKCWLVQIKDYAKGKDLFLKDYAYLSGVSKTWHDHCLELVNYSINKFKLKKNDNILEIASNDGTLLKYFKKSNFNVLGIEPTSSTANIAIKNGIQTIVDFFGLNLSKKIRNQHSFKMIIANNVIAHVDNVRDFIEGLSYLSNDTTIISLEFQYLPNLIKNNQFDTIYHEHFSYYSLFSFQNLINQYDLKIFDVKKINTHGGSLRVFLCKKNNLLRVSKNTHKILNNEIKFGINKLSFYLNFQKKVFSLKKSFQRNISQILESNKTIFAYGAAAKGNTFLNFMNLTEKEIKLIFDKNHYKHNKLSPGGLIPIVNINKFKKKFPDYILILAWNLKREIVNDLRKNYQFKGNFIVSIPKFEIFN